MVWGKYKDVVLCADIGGTNANFSILSLDYKRPKELFSFHYKTQETRDFSLYVDDFLRMAKDKGFSPDEACFAVAGPIENTNAGQKVRMTNSRLVIDSAKLKKKTGLKKIMLINDFIAISYATNVLRQSEIQTINNGKPQRDSTIAVIGAGTGLGKSILYYNPHTGAYHPMPSEGGHVDISIYDKNELDIILPLKRKANPITFEEIVSGRGLEYLYRHFWKEYKKCPKNLKAINISKSRKTNTCSRKAYRVFIKFYARACRNFALDSLSTGGLYIAGGIAAANSDAFGKDFLIEFFKNHKYSDILKKIPVKVIKNYGISPIGAAVALRLNRGVKTR